MEELVVESPVDPHRRLVEWLAETSPRKIVVVTGAGISAASGIPTFRGEEGYWTENSANYQPQELGYLSTFRARPRDVWQLNLYFRGVCLKAQPNAAHLALAQLERELGDDFLLVTQNVDGLHLRAGNTPARTIEGHGSLHFMRGLDGDASLIPVPDQAVLDGRGQALDDARWSLLRTPTGALARPHTLFFDEAYDDTLYRTREAKLGAQGCDLLIVVGTSGATALPWSLAVAALEADAAILTIDPDDTPFGVHARNRERVGKGLWLRGSASDWVPRVVDAVLTQREQGRPPRPTKTSARAPRPRLSVVSRRVALAPRRARRDPGYRSSRALAELLGARPPRQICVVTGAGISAASGVPLFRGPGGYWNAERRPTTRADFEADPRRCWAEYLRRRASFRAAAPNPAHLALAELEYHFGDALTLITQNIDGLHLRAGNSRARCIELHGSCELMRAIEGDPHPVPLPAELELGPDGSLPDATWQALRMPDGAPARPHVLLWDESYNEVQYRSESALRAGASCDLLIVIGTSGVAALPYAVAAEAVLSADASLINLDPADNPYAEHARQRAREHKGLWLKGPATQWLPELVAQLIACQPDSPA